MGKFTNTLGQPIGFPLAEWQARPYPPRMPITGRTCTVEPLDADKHAASLYASMQGEQGQSLWTYLPYGPYASLDAYRPWVVNASQSEDPLFFAIIDRARARAVGIASYLRIEPAVGVIEVGHINFSPQLQRTTAATEAMFLMMRRTFDELGYRRYEWKCDALNAGSRAAAQRLGFTFEGVFRQATMYKGRNRDTAWFSIIDSEWPALRLAFERWLEPENFDGQERQKTRLIDLINLAQHK